MRNTPDYDLSTATWRKSSYSQGGSDCLEITDAHPGVVPVRDSENPDGPKLALGTEAWAAFVEGVASMTWPARRSRVRASPPCEALPSPSRRRGPTRLRGTRRPRCRPAPSM
ncbi:DUF397 domain-containing protein [Streptomyces sp. NPDC001107]